MLSLLGHPDDGRDVRDLLSKDGGRIYEWNREHELNAAEEQGIRERLNVLTAARQELGEGSQAAAVSAIRKMLPEDIEKVVLTWSDQGDFLSLEELVMADGAVIESDDEDYEDVWGEIDIAASDIREQGTERRRRQPSRRTGELRSYL